MASLSDDQSKILADLKKEAELRKEISSSLTSYLEAVKDAKKLEEEINKLNNLKLQAEAEKNRLIAAGSTLTSAEVKAQEDLLAVLEHQEETLQRNKNILDKTINSVDKYQLLVNRGLVKGGLGMVKIFSNLGNIIENSYGKIKNMGLFEIDKAIKGTALSMGLSSKQTKLLSQNIDSARMSTTMLGSGMAQLAQYQGEYSDEIGRSVMLGDSGLKSINLLAKGTVLGAEGAAKMAAEFEQQGISAERTANYFDQVSNDSSRMGINTGKVVKNIQQNFKMLNKYNFKNGVKGLAKMAETTTKLGVDMTFATGMAEKLFDIEGAVDMSAQLQVLGGEWSKLADPFKLMYMARNDMAGLTESIGEAAKESAFFNKQTQSYEISALEMQRLRKVSEQTGIEFESLATAAKNARKFSDIKGQVSFDMDKESKEFLINTAQLDEKGRGYIEINGDKKFLNELSKTQINQLIADKQNLEERAKAARNFDETLTNAINLFKESFFPFVQKLEPMIKGLDNFVNKAQADGWFQKIQDFASSVGTIAATIGKFILENPIKSAFIYFGTKILADTITWVANGFALAQGFEAGIMGDGLSGMAKGFAKAAGPLLGGMLVVSISTLAASLAGKGFDAIFGKKKKSDSLWKKAGRILTMTGAGAGTGAAVGSLGLGVGAVPGAVIGGIAGLGKGLYDEFTTESMDDGIIQFNKRDKFMKVNDSTMIAGTNENGNKDLANTLKYGALTALSTLPGLGILNLLNKPNKNINNSGVNSVKHEFGDLNITGEIILRTAGNEKINVDLTKNPEFVKEITKMIHVEAAKMKNQVQTSK